METRYLGLLGTVIVSTIIALVLSTYLETRVESQFPYFLSLVRDKSLCNVNEMLDAVTGSMFEMDKKRSYNGPRLRKSDLVFNNTSKPEGMICDNWVVVTSVNDPTVVVKQLAESNEKLCLVVVADKKSPNDYDVNRSHVVYLTVEEQEKLQYNIMKLVPWNHFARKNIGFLYAIEHGAKQIFDLDDDNELISTKHIIHITTF